MFYIHFAPLLNNSPYTFTTLHNSFFLTYYFLIRIY